MKTRSDKVNEIETSQPEETLSENGQVRRTFLKHAGNAVYVAPVLFVLSQNTFGRETPGKSAPGRTSPGSRSAAERGPVDRTMSGPLPPDPP